jgi:hypothetical protein
MSVRCIVCEKEIFEYGGILVSMDGDFVCSTKCKKDNELNIDRVNNMTDKEFHSYMTSK